jgi:IS30 family transposase
MAAPIRLTTDSCAKMLVKVANKDTDSVVSALIKQSQRLPSELYRSLTWDRGKELADHP